MADNRWLLKNICYLCHDFEYFHNIKDNIKMKKHILSSLLLAVALGCSMLFTACSNTDNIVPDIPGNPKMAEFFKANGFTIDEGTTDNRYVITHYLEIAPWFTLTAEELQGV